ncbi:helix-turn-helix domain-containing protein [Immundisolibacter sp.]|uniref:helix-turn-helix domain-containing protein n=1 Tax=Immundisolibacter sp. TaxID=1934948 RepID=UPI003458889D
MRPEDRVVIAGMTRLGAGTRAIAHALERSPSTINRQLAPVRRRLFLLRFPSGAGCAGLNHGVSR